MSKKDDVGLGAVFFIFSCILIGLGGAGIYGQGEDYGIGRTADIGSLNKDEMYRVVSVLPPDSLHTTFRVELMSERNSLRIYAYGESVCVGRRYRVTKVNNNGMLRLVEPAIPCQ